MLLSGGGKSNINNKYYDKYYEKIGKEYNNIRLDTKNNMENVIRIIKKYVDIENARILDIGCGTGKYGEMMKANGYDVVGIEKLVENADYVVDGNNKEEEIFESIKKFIQQI